MNKYIPADKVLAEIERLEHENCMNGGEHFCMRKAICLGNLRNIITPLYHEQQEQPEVDLEKAIDKYFSKWVQGASDEGCFNADSQLVSIYDCHRIARHFYERGQSIQYQKDRAEFAKLKAKEWQKGFDEGLNARKDKLPEIELDKFTEKIRTFQGRYKHPEIISIKGAMAFMARMFYQYPNVARLWYEQLPKATMD